MPSIHCCNIHRTNQYRNEIRLLNLYAVNLVLLYHDMFNLLKHLCMHTSSPNLISRLWLAISTSTTPPKSKTEPPKRKKGKIISDLVGMPALSQLNRSFLNISKNSKWFKGFGFQHSLAFYCGFTWFNMFHSDVGITSCCCIWCKTPFKERSSIQMNHLRNMRDNFVVVVVVVEQKSKKEWYGVQSALGHRISQFGKMNFRSCIQDINGFILFRILFYHFYVHIHIYRPYFI